MNLPEPKFNIWDEVYSGTRKLHVTGIGLAKPIGGCQTTASGFVYALCTISDKGDTREIEVFIKEEHLKSEADYIAERVAKLEDEAKQLGYKLVKS